MDYRGGDSAVIWATTQQTHGTSGDAANNIRRRMAGHQVDKYDLPARSLDHLVANHALAGVVGTFDEYIRSYKLYQFKRRVLFEYDHEGDGFECSEDFGAALGRIDRPGVALQPPC